ncbi:MAG: Asp-tRNA(Asn)/Glu-tRNA(Gln) amidotransferase subunit GatA [Deltaproteobacteria bacterium]|jgi:aspartyl-tRNA(Asn)/glutamyl-tRNA(Gln) amidotransferase subunit A|nr:Asp-tRNA(Asn)/Glu-tRNA(Gln) amidotransferase subunit GatA [Deltaproteobacteria bacterium]
MTELWRLDLGQATLGLSSRRFSATELVSSALERIRETEPLIGACLAVLEEQALARARELDEAGYDETKPLWGLPIAVKDVFCLAGPPTTAGSKILANYHPVFEAAVVRKLKEAGAVIVAKTNCDEFAMGSSTEFSAFGPTKNPWRLDRVPGGSSGGAAASVAAFQTAGGLGTDTGGSIRQPAALCGCFGLKPTYGRVSRYGIVAYGSSFDQAGPLARNVDDLARLLTVIAGPDGRDSTASSREVPDYRRLDPVKPNELTLGLPKELWSADFEPEVAKILAEAKERIAAAGATLKEVSLPNLRFSVATYYILAAAEASTNLARYDGVRYGFRDGEENELVALYRNSRTKAMGAEVKRRIMLGAFVLSSGYYDAYFRKAAQVRRLIWQDYSKALEQCDLLLAPVSSILAWPFGAFTADPLKVYQLDMMTLPLNLVGAPGLSLPAGLSESGLPTGLQLMGRAFEEPRLLAAAKALEGVLPPVGAPSFRST